ncbi:MAG: amidohydrolase family protein [Verrucomicrobia bacterium]|nr:amidohydrolase family protein [Verrucomicrobiota bacterium]
MGASALLVLRARVVLPIRRPLIENGAVVISGRRIAAVGSWTSIRRRHSGRTLDLGEVILLPGLVNAHCHLDYTRMAGMFPPPRGFCDWIKTITTEKSLWSDADFAVSWRDGAAMLLRSGTTTVADIEAMPQLLPKAWQRTPLRVISLLEMTGIRSRRDPDSVLGEAATKIDSLPRGRCFAGLSPHAPYSTLPRLMNRCGVIARRRRWLVATHLAESATEFEMFRHARGEMFDWLRRNEREMSDCGGISPVQHLAATGLLGANLIATHVNYLAPGDASLLAGKRVSVVHCPRSHDYFRHRVFPYGTLARAGVNICLGTDSLATVRKHPRRDLELNLFHEMRAFAARHSRLASERILQMVTINGARALGLRGEIGELAKHAWADVIALPFSGSVGQSYDAVLEHRGGVSASMIDGHWAIPPH